MKLVCIERKGRKQEEEKDEPKHHERSSHHQHQFWLRQYHNPLMKINHLNRKDNTTGDASFRKDKRQKAEQHIPFATMGTVAMSLTFTEKTKKKTHLKATGRNKNNSIRPF
jgi:hypothetical protein